MLIICYYLAPAWTEKAFSQYGSLSLKGEYYILMPITTEVRIRHSCNSLEPLHRK